MICFKSSFLTTDVQSLSGVSVSNVHIQGFSQTFINRVSFRSIWHELCDALLTKRSSTWSIWRNWTEGWVLKELNFTASACYWSVGDSEWTLILEKKKSKWVMNKNKHGRVLNWKWSEEECLSVTVSVETQSSCHDPEIWAARTYSHTHTHTHTHTPCLCVCVCVCTCTGTLFTAHLFYT